MLKNHVAFVLSWAIAALAAPPALLPRQNSSPTVTIDSGPIIGTSTSFASASINTVVHQYLGVPFAASPTRFSPAQTTSWSSPHDATQRGPACIQQFNYPEASRNFTTEAFNTPAPEESEDCLSVNVFVPAGAEGGSTLKPVMFWIYGMLKPPDPPLGH